MNKPTDAAILELAELYLTEEPALSLRAGELADHIRDEIEDWISAAKDEAEEAGKE